MNKSDFLLYISFLLIILAMLIFCFYQYTEKVNKCTSDPLKFAVEKIRDNYDSNNVHGTITITNNYTFKSWDFGDKINYLNFDD